MVIVGGSTGAGTTRTTSIGAGGTEPQLVHASDSVVASTPDITKVCVPAGTSVMRHVGSLYVMLPVHPDGSVPLRHDKLRDDTHVGRM